MNAIPIVSLENQYLKVAIHPKGAELQSIRHLLNGLEYMWGADPAVWGKHSPLLFPIVGTVKQDTYYYQDRPYSLPRHGFARDMVFTVEAQGGEQVTFLLESNEETLKKYPFPFELRIIYKLDGATLSTTYDVTNSAGAEDLYFSVGGHPAFRVPLVGGTVYNDYYLQFSQKESAPRWPISADGLILSDTVPVLQDSDRISLSHELFARDALVFKGLRSRSVSLASDKTKHGLTMDFPDFPFLGIWAAKNADFVCIEPWCGIADAADTDQQLVHKEGIVRLEAGGRFTRTWKIRLF